MRKHFFFICQPEEILKHLREELDVQDIVDKETHYRACNEKIQISKLESLVPHVPNVVLTEDISPEGEWIPDAQARATLESLRKKFGVSIRKAEKYWFPDMNED